MPLRDHFHKTAVEWESVHAFWPAMIVQRLNAAMPDRFVARPCIHIGQLAEIDVAAFDHLDGGWSPERDRPGEGGTAVAAWASTVPTLLLDTEIAEPSEYEVNVYSQEDMRLVAAIELVSPSNKDRTEHRQSFVNKCETLLQKGVCVIIVDVVSNRTANLYGELADEFRAKRTDISRSRLYAVTCLGQRKGPRWRLGSWEFELKVGSPLPTLPIWLSPELQVPLELEMSYEDTCKALKIR